MYYFILDDKASKDLGFVVTRRPSMPAPQKKYQEYEIPGRNGKLYQDLGTYDDIQFNIECNYISNSELWHVKWRDIKKWLLKQKIRKLSLSDNLEFYFLVKKIELSENDREVIESGEFTITLTCDPYNYRTTGLNSYPIKDVTYNRYETSKPVYKISGEGICHLSVNGIDCCCNVGQNLTIDTSLEMSYREDGTLQNTAINVDYKDLYLLEGKNSITISEGFELKIIPNWRCI